jgi:hypothetical protein
MPRAAQNRIDLRATRFSALITAIVLGLALVFGPVFGLPLIAVQTFVFAIGAIMGMRLQPYLTIYSKYVQPRRGTPVEMVSERPHRFTAALGMLLGCISLLAGVMSADILYYVVTGVAFAAAAVHAAMGKCLGCAWYERLVAAISAPPRTEVDLTAAPNSADQRPEHDTLA